MDRFRPNIVIQGCKPGQEDTMKQIKIADVIFDLVKPCIRCVVTTIDPETLEAGKEPLKMLSKQKVDGKVVFGQHVLALAEGHVKIGDEITILSKKESPYDTLQ